MPNLIYLNIEYLPIKCLFVQFINRLCSYFYIKNQNYLNKNEYIKTMILFIITLFMKI